MKLKVNRVGIQKMRMEIEMSQEFSIVAKRFQQMFCNDYTSTSNITGATFYYVDDGKTKGFQQLNLARYPRNFLSPLRVKVEEKKGKKHVLKYNIQFTLYLLLREIDKLMFWESLVKNFYNKGSAEVFVDFNDYFITTSLLPEIYWANGKIKTLLRKKETSVEYYIFNSLWSTAGEENRKRLKREFIMLFKKLLPEAKVQTVAEEGYGFRLRIFKR